MEEERNSGIHEIICPICNFLLKEGEFTYHCEVDKEHSYHIFKNKSETNIPFYEQLKVGNYTIISGYDFAGTTELRNEIQLILTYPQSLPITIETLEKLKKLIVLS